MATELKDGDRAEGGAEGGLPQRSFGGQAACRNWEILWIFLWDPRPIIGNPCHLLTNSVAFRRHDWYNPSMWRCQVNFFEIVTVLMLMMRIMLTTVCCRFGSWGLFIKSNIWPKEVNLTSRTQPSGPLCLWQCFPSGSGPGGSGWRHADRDKHWVQLLFDM